MTGRLPQSAELPAAGNFAVSVLMVSYNTRERILTCIESVLAENYPGLQVIVLDNASADGSATAVEKRFPEVTVVRSDRNLGFGRAVNIAAEHARGEYLMLLNPDTTMRGGSIDALVDFARRNPDYGVYGGRTLRPDGSLDPSSCWGAPSLWSMFCFATGLSTVFRRTRIFDPESLGDWQRDSVRVVPIITGCLLLVRRTDFQRIGGMDQRYFLYGEDADFSARAAAAGYRPVVVPDAVIVHDNGGSTGGGGLKLCMVWAGRSTYLRTHWSGPAAAVGVGLLQVGALLRSAGEYVTSHHAGSWTTVWRRRRDWRSGYPAARVALFPPTESPAVEVQAVDFRPTVPVK